MMAEELDRGESVAEFANSRRGEWHQQQHRADDQRKQQSGSGAGGGYERFNAAANFAEEERSLGAECTAAPEELYDRTTAVSANTFPLPLAL
jgi:hypothetical protein